jgi:hypothetical protein
MQTEKIKPVQKPVETFHQRLDFYWQSIAIYAVVLLLYGLFKGSLEKGEFTIALYDPVVILMSLFMLASAIGLAVNYYKNKSVTVGKDYLIFRTRLHEKRFTAGDIIRIGIKREKPMKMHNRFSVIKIKVKSRRRVIRIRPSSFWNEPELIHSVIQLKKNLAK